MSAQATRVNQLISESFGLDVEQSRWRTLTRQISPNTPVAGRIRSIGGAVDLGYLCAAEVTATLERRPSHVDVILTGPAMPAALMAMADQVTQLRRGF